MSAESSFIRWLQLAGIESPKCGVGEVAEGGRGVIATKYISKDEIVVSVPDEAVLMPENCVAAEVVHPHFDCVCKISTEWFVGLITIRGQL